ncbi:hypothetical protein D3C75_938070 [compost metagenome]
MALRDDSFTDPGCGLLVSRALFRGTVFCLGLYPLFTRWPLAPQFYGINDGADHAVCHHTGAKSAYFCVYSCSAADVPGSGFRRWVYAVGDFLRADRGIRQGVPFAEPSIMASGADG